MESRLDHLGYVNARAIKDKLESEFARLSRALRAIEGVGSGPNGLTPDSVRSSAKFISAKREADLAFNALKDFNSKFCKTFAKEYAADRKANATR